MNIKNTLNLISDLVYNNRVIFFILIGTIALLIIDISLINISRYTTSQSLSGWRTTVFIVIAIISAIVQFLILKFVKLRSEAIKGKKEFSLEATYTAVRVIQFLLIGIFTLAILQILVSFRYNVFILLATIGISYTLAVILMGLLAKRFLSWFKSNKSSVVLLYGLSAAIIAINLVFTIIYVASILPTHQLEIRAHTSFATPFRPSGSTISFLNDIYFITSVISFMVTWIATAMLLRHYSQRLGRIKYWAIISIPLAYFMSQFQPLFVNLFYQSLQSSPVFFSILSTLIFTFSKPLGGILFGIAFWTTAKKLRKDSVVRDYITIAAYGLILLFASNQAIVLVTTSYPPFGLITTSFVGLSSYLILVGVYYSAISVSEDIKIRQTIRKFALKESKLLDSIGTSHMEDELQRRVMKLAKEQQEFMMQQTGVEPSLDEGEAKQYLYEVMQEIKKTQ
jgi:hypothetical protein